MTQKTPRRVTAVYESAGEPGWWTVTIPEFPGCISQGRGIAQAREHIREALSLFVDDADDAEIVDDVRLPGKAKRAIEAYQKAREAAESAQNRASERSREAVRVLVADLGMSTRDAGAALGVSQARIAQLAREGR